AFSAESRVSSRSGSSLYHHALLWGARFARFARTRRDCAHFLSGPRTRSRSYGIAEQVGRRGGAVQENPAAKPERPRNTFSARPCRAFQIGVSRQYGGGQERI